MSDVQKAIWAVVELETLQHLATADDWRDVLTRGHCGSARLTLERVRHALTVRTYFELGCRIAMVEQRLGGGLALPGPNPC
jgi:hypothetical protein